MFVKISKADAEQSIGFALTSATEEYERVRDGIGEAFQLCVQTGQTVSPAAQEESFRALSAARQNVENIQTLKAMIDFTREEDGVLLDVNSFALLRPNLPAR